MTALDALDVLVVPGLGSSGPVHWQTLWERRWPAWRRVEQDDWERPVCTAWVARLAAEVAHARRPVLLVAHSLGCSTVVHAAAAGHLGPVVGAFLVAMPDVERADFPADVCVGFAPLPPIQLPFPTVMVGSTNDPWIDEARLRAATSALGADYVDAGAGHHLGSAADLGEWPEGWRHLEALAARA